MAKLYFIYGCMSCSKSAQLLMKAHSFEERNIPFLCIKPTIDIRDGKNVIKSRIGISRECLSIEGDDDIYNIIVKYIETITLQCIESPQWILVDEAQFLQSKQVDQLAQLVDEYNINVICYGLRTDFLTESFQGSKRLMEIADNIEEMKTTCGCGNKAIVNARFKDDELITDGEQIVIGGNELYIPLCRRCYNKLKIMNVKKY